MTTKEISELKRYFSDLVSALQSMLYEPPESKIHRRRADVAVLHIAQILGGDDETSKVAKALGWVPQ